MIDADDDDLRDIDTTEARIHCLAGTLYYALQLNRGDTTGPVFSALPHVDQLFFESLVRLALKAAAHWTVPARTPGNVVTGLERPDKVIGAIAPKEVL
jgi:hypothetical protein